MSLDAYAAAMASRRQPPTGAAAGAAVSHPNDMALEVNLRESVWRLLEDDDPENTKKAFEPKMKEYFVFCCEVYPLDPHNHILQREKMYRFMYYQAFREKKKRGGPRSARANAPSFDNLQYEQVMSHFQAPGAAGLREFPTPKKPISVSVFDLYKAMFRKMFGIQKMRQVLTPQWDDLWTNDFNALRKHVLQRVPKHKRETFQEKVTGEFAPYMYVEHYDKIEEKLWNESTKHSAGRVVASSPLSSPCA